MLEDYFRSPKTSVHLSVTEAVLVRFLSLCVCFSIIHLISSLKYFKQRNCIFVNKSFLIVVIFFMGKRSCCRKKVEKLVTV